MKIILAGATGFIGTPLVEALITAGHDVSVLTRFPESSLHPQAKRVIWNGRTVGDWAKEIDGADAVINLAGENIAAGKWSGLRKKKILISRVYSTQAITQAIQKAAQKPKVLINASAVGCRRCESGTGESKRR